MKIELVFPLNGASFVPVDHAHGLYGALKAVVPGLESLSELGIHTLRGVPQPGGTLLLTPRLKNIRFRLGLDAIPTALQLVGKSINVLGSPFVIGAPEVHQLLPSKTLWARIVTLHFEDTDWEAARLQLQKHLIKACPDAEWEIRRPRTIRIHQKQILGFEVLAKRLTTDQSLELQCGGVGGRRAFGCGLFVRVGDQPSQDKRVD